MHRTASLRFFLFYAALAAEANATVVINNRADASATANAASSLSATGSITGTATTAAPTVTASPQPKAISLSFDTPGSVVCIDALSSFCTQFAQSSDNSTIAVLVQSAYKGYIELTIGSNSIVAWSNTVSLRIESSTGPPANATEQAQLSILPESQADSIFSLSLTQNERAALTVAFTTPAAFFALDGSTYFSYAVCSTPPSSSSSLVASIPTPDGPTGSFSFDIATSSTPSTNLVAIPKSVVAHAVVMFFAWGIFPYLIIGFAPLLKVRLGETWRLLHAGFALIGIFGFTVVGMLVIAVGQSEGLVFFSGSTHAALGSVIVFIGMPIQIISGAISHYWYNPERWSTPVWDHAHWAFGALLIVAAIVNIYLGIEVSGVDSTWIVGYAVWFALMLVLVAAGYIWNESVKRKSMRLSMRLSTFNPHQNQQQETMTMLRHADYPIGSVEAGSLSRRKGTVAESEIGVVSMPRNAGAVGQHAANEGKTFFSRFFNRKETSTVLAAGKIIVENEELQTKKTRSDEIIAEAQATLKSVNTLSRKLEVRSENEYEITLRAGTVKEPTGLPVREAPLVPAPIEIPSTANKSNNNENSSIFSGLWFLKKKENAVPDSLRLPPNPTIEPVLYVPPPQLAITIPSINRKSTIQQRSPDGDEYPKSNNSLSRKSPDVSELINNNVSLPRKAGTMRSTAAGNNREREPPIMIPAAGTFGGRTLTLERNKKSPTAATASDDALFLIAENAQKKAGAAAGSSSAKKTAAIAAAEKSKKGSKPASGWTAASKNKQSSDSATAAAVAIESEVEVVFPPTISRSKRDSDDTDAVVVGFGL
ncbi:hypothetical protein HK100_001284 [Physocladia obscura]|uniref:Cytochrome b561 domain-containing protein n=1 Tax=Physocladia obscura TaxID=109957 RepID=A0AAD5T914_9FUNG|nr:hypothetical protein HK100_001284 [Physocladia obscura]